MSENKVELGINTIGLSPSILKQLESSVAGAIQANRDTVDTFRAQAADIQRRGVNLGGDTGQNFGMNAGNIHGWPYSWLMPRDFSGMFGGASEFGQFGGFMGGMVGFGGSSRIHGSMSAFSGRARMAHYKMGLCVEAYKGFGVAKNVIDLMANFASEGLTIKHKSKAVEKFYKRWAEHVDLQGRVKDILRYYYKYANVFIYTTYGKIDTATYNKMRRAKGTRSLKGFVEIRGDVNDPAADDKKKKIDEEKGKNAADKEIPWRYTMLNPFQMDLRGSKYFGQSKWVFILDPLTANDIDSGEYSSNTEIDFLDRTEINLPPEFKNLSQQGENPLIVDVDPAKLWTLHYMKDDHEDWADPLLWPVMSDISYKNKLRQMDISVADSVINAVTIFKIGDFKNGFIPPEEHFRAFAEFLRTPTAAMNMVWNDAISIESNYPPVDRILNVAKYEAVDRDILRGLGVPDSLLGGTTGSSFSTGFLGVRTLLERLEEGRQTVTRWINSQLKTIADIMGHRDIPKIKFGRMSLRDEKAEKQLIMGLLDRNIISIEAVLEAFGEDFEIELERMRDEKKIRERDELLIKHGPFTEPLSEQYEEEQEGMPTLNKPSPRGKPENKNRPPRGRPGGTTDIKQKPRETKPKGMAWLMDWEVTRANELDRLEKVYDIVTKIVLKTKGKKYKKSLTKKDRTGIENISFGAASYLLEEVTPASVINTLRDGDTCGYHPDILERFEQIIPGGTMNKTATLVERKHAMATAIASYRMGV